MNREQLLQYCIELMNLYTKESEKFVSCLPPMTLEELKQWYKIPGNKANLKKQKEIVVKLYSELDRSCNKLTSLPKMETTRD